MKAEKGPVKVSPRLRELLLDFTMQCLLEQPELVVPYAVEYFQKILNGQTTLDYDLTTGLEEEDSEEEECIYERRRTTNVYAEGFDPDKVAEEKDEVFPKTDEQKQRLREVAEKCPLFRCLDSDQMERVINVMFPMEVSSGTYVIKQYQPGDNFYIIENGRYDVLIAPKPGGTSEHVYTYENQGHFGELALMYNMPRAASIKAVTSGLLWAMDRQTFRRVVLVSASQKRKRFEQLIKSITYLENLSSFEKMNLADALVLKNFSAGDVIFNQGDHGDGMYFIEKGSVKVTMYHKLQNATKDLATLTRGEYFGELAPLFHQPRAATVTCLEDTRLAFLEREAFWLLESARKDLKGRVKDYNDIAGQAFGDKCIDVIQHTYK